MTRTARIYDAAQFARDLDRLADHREWLQRELPTRLTDRRLFVLVLAYARPISARDLADFVRGVQTVPRFAKLHLLGYRSAAYQLLHRLARRGLLQRGVRDTEVVFRLRRAVRARIRAALDRGPDSRE